MKTIKKLTITVTYTVGLDNVEVPDEVYDDLTKHYDDNVWSVPEDSIAAEWIADNIEEKDAMDRDYEINDLRG